MTTSHLPIRLYSLFDFDRSAKARWLLKEMNVPFEERRMDRENLEHEKPEYLRINPMGRVPSLQMGDHAMFESGAICAYLADYFIDRGMAPPLTAPARLDYQKWMYFASTTLDTFQTRIMVIEDIPEGELRTQKESALLTELHDAVEAMDETLARRDYLVSDKISAADICVGYQLFWLTLWPELKAVIEKFPRVSAYLARLMAMPSAKSANVFSYPG